MVNNDELLMMIIWLFKENALCSLIMNRIVDLYRTISVND